jgi:hypothetical protein
MKLIVESAGIRSRGAEIALATCAVLILMQAGGRQDGSGLFGAPVGDEWTFQRARAEWETVRRPVMHVGIPGSVVPSLRNRQEK